MDKLMLEPVQAGYAVSTPDGEVLRAAVPGGTGRYRADIEGGSSLVNASWILSDIENQYIWSFFRNRTHRGASPFLLDLVIEDCEMSERICHYMPGSLKLDGRSGDNFYVSAQLEVEAIEADELFDSSLVDVFEIAGDDSLAYLNGFAEIVANLPEA